MKMVHSYWAYLVIGLLLFAVINAILNAKKEFKEKDLRIALFTLIVSHIQLLIGFGWYFMSPAYKHLKESGMGATMKDSHARMLTVEHPTMMILAIIFITIGFSKHKKQTTDAGKFKTILIWYGLALLFVLSRIPWSQWL
jgi:heme A synthase